MGLFSSITKIILSNGSIYFINGNYEEIMGKVENDRDGFIKIGEAYVKVSSIVEIKEFDD